MATTKKIDCSECGTTNPVEMAGAYATFNCDDCGAPQIAV